MGLALPLAFGVAGAGVAVGLKGGPVGAVVGGVAGLILGAVVGAPQPLTVRVPINREPLSPVATQALRDWLTKLFLVSRGQSVDCSRFDAVERERAQREFGHPLDQNALADVRLIGGQWLVRLSTASDRFLDLAHCNTDQGTDALLALGYRIVEL